MLKKIFSIFWRIAISVVLLIFLLKQVDSHRLLGIIKNSDKHFLFTAFFVSLLPYLFCLFRWEMLLKTASIHLPLKRVIMSFAGGVFFSLFLPSTIGGDVVRSLDLATHTRRPHEVIATVLLDRLSGYMGLVIVAVLALFFGHRYIQDRDVFFSVGIITAILVVILLVIFNRFLYLKINRLLHSPTAGKIRQLIRGLHQEMHIFRHHKDMAIDNLLLSVTIQVAAPLIFYLIALAIGAKLSFLYFFIYVPIISAITLLPISIGGLGLRDATTVYFFAKAGMPKDLAFAMSLLNFFFIVVYAALGGLIYVLTIPHRRTPHHQTPDI